MARRDLVWINVTPHPTAEWIARQITEAFPWNEAPRYLIRDRDRVYGAAITARLRAMGRRRICKIDGGICGRRICKMGEGVEWRG